MMRDLAEFWFGGGKRCKNNEGQKLCRGGGKEWNEKGSRQLKLSRASNRRSAAVSVVVVRNSLSALN